MSGKGGGGVGTVSLPDYMDDVISAWLGTYSSGPIVGGPLEPPMMDDNYLSYISLSPAVRRAIKRNPYSTHAVATGSFSNFNSSLYQSPSGYNMSLGTAVQFGKTKLDALDYDTNFSTIADFAKARELVVNSGSNLGSASIGSGAISRANTAAAAAKAASIGSTNASTDPSTLFNTMFDAVVTKLTSFLPSISSVTQNTASKSYSDVFYNGAISKATDQVVPDTTWTAYDAAAVANILHKSLAGKYDKFDEIDLAATFAAAVTAANSRFSTMLSAATQLLTDQQLWTNYTGSVKSVIDAAGYLTAVDPAAIITQAGTDASTWLTTADAGKSKHGITSDTGLFSTIAAAAKTAAEAAGSSVFSFDLSTLQSNVNTKGGGIYTSNLSVADAIAIAALPANILDTEFTSAAARANTDVVPLDLTNPHTTVLSNILSAYTAAKANATTDVVYATKWSEMLVAALSWVGTNNADVSITTVNTDAKASADSLYTATLALAASGFTTKKDWASIVNAAIAKADTIGVLGGVSASTLYSQAWTSVSGNNTALETLAGSSLTISTILQALASGAISKADTAGVLNAVSASGLMTTAQSSVSAANAAIESLAASGINVSTIIAALAAAAIAKADTPGNLGSVAGLSTVGEAVTNVSNAQAALEALAASGINISTVLGALASGAITKADAVGNLVALNPSAFALSAKTDLETYNTAIETLSASGLNVASLLAGLASGAITKADTLGVLTIVDHTALNTDAVNTVNTINTTLEALAASGINVATILAALVSGAAAKAATTLTEISATTAATSAKGSVQANWSALETLVGSDVSEASQLAGLLVAALSWANTNVGTADVANVSSTARSDAASGLSNAMATIDSVPQFDENALWPTYVADAITKADGLGVLTAVDIAAIISSAGASATSMLTAALNAVGSQMQRDPKTLWENALADAVSKANVAGNLVAVALSGAEANAKTEAGSVLATFIAAIGNRGIDENTDWPSLIAEAVAKADQVGLLTTINASTLATTARAGAATSLSSALASLSTGISEASDWEGIVNAAIAKVDTAGVLTSVDISPLISAAQGGASDEIALAVASAVAAIDNAAIAEAIAAFTAQSIIDKDQAIRTYSASMAGANAVQTSAYLFGLAIIESQRLQAVANFTADLKKQAYSEAFRAHIEVYRNDLQARLTLELQDKLSREEFIRGFLNGRMQVKGLDIDYKKAQLSYHGAALAQQLDTEFRAAQQNKMSREQFMRDYAAGKISLKELRIQAENMQLQNYLNAWSELLRAELAAAQQNKSSRDEFISRAMDARLNANAIVNQYDQALLQYHSQALSNNLSARTSIAAQAKDSREDFIKWHADGKSDLLALRTDFEKAQLDFYARVFTQRVAEGVQLAVSDKMRRDDLIRSYLDEHLALLGVRKGEEANKRQAVIQSFLSTLDNIVRTDSINKEAKERFIAEEAARHLSLYELDANVSASKRSEVTDKFLGILTAKIQAAATNKQSREGFIADETQRELAIRQLDKQVESDKRESVSRRYETLVGSHGQGAAINKQSREDFIQQEAERHLSLYQLSYQDTAEKRRVLAQRIAEAAQLELQADITNKQAREQFIREEAERHLSLYELNVQDQAARRASIVDRLRLATEAEVNAALANKQSREQFIREEAQRHLALYELTTQDTQEKRRSLVDRLNTAIQSENQAAIVNKQSREEFIRNFGLGELALLGPEAEHIRVKADLYNQLYGQQLQARLNTAFQNKDSKMQSTMQHAAGASEIYGRGLQESSTRLAEYGNLYRARLAAEIEKEVTNKQSREGYLARYVSERQVIEGLRFEYEKATMAQQAEIYRNVLQSEMQSAVANQDAKNRFVLEGVDAILRIIMARFQYEQTMFGLQQDSAKATTQVRLAPQMEKQESRHDMLQSGTSQIADIQRAKFDYQIAQVRAMQEQFSGEMGLALREKETNKSAREEQYSRAIQAMLQLKLADLEIKRGIIQSYPQVAMDMMRLLNTEDTQSTDWKLQMMNIGQNSMTEIHNMKQAYERQMASIFADLFEKEFNGALTDATVVKSARDQFIQFGVDQMMRGMYQEVDSSQRYAAIAADQMRFGITSQREYEKDLVEAKTGYADWDLSHALQGMTILSNPMTGASYVPGRPSRGQAVGQGVLTGMGAGAAAGSVLGVPGILAGGIIGGLGGLFS